MATKTTKQETIIEIRPIETEIIPIRGGNIFVLSDRDDREN